MSMYSYPCQNQLCWETISSQKYRGFITYSVCLVGYRSIRSDWCFCIRAFHIKSENSKSPLSLFPSSYTYYKGNLRPILSLLLIWVWYTNHRSLRRSAPVTITKPPRNPVRVCTLEIRMMPRITKCWYNGTLPTFWMWLHPNKWAIKPECRITLNTTTTTTPITRNHRPHFIICAFPFMTRRFPSCNYKMRYPKLYPLSIKRYNISNPPFWFIVDAAYHEVSRSPFYIWYGMWKNDCYWHDWLVGGCVFE